MPSSPPAPLATGSVESLVLPVPRESVPSPTAAFPAVPSVAASPPAFAPPMAAESAAVEPVDVDPDDAAVSVGSNPPLPLAVPPPAGPSTVFPKVSSRCSSVELPHATAAIAIAMSAILRRAGRGRRGMKASGLEGLLNGFSMIMALWLRHLGGGGLCRMQPHLPSKSVQKNDKPLCCVELNVPRSVGCAARPSSTTALPFLGAPLPFLGASLPFLGASLPFLGIALPLLRTARPLARRVSSNV